ncbi:DUF1828 domain-containing protein [Alloacidobacterium dinghuense]|uniref:DUF1828 domain-containing protein n=1 Tax=Alloacidobacterium dinghuense TaxID=2763107 RepID=A0A7G8BG27_9BACT|nr:DUF1828 domain-containing protein [Alloacidobacterium dinghuense]QNI31497.1 DUF1828 domain-containing protein [Alloacidobacterium dinghuense]
MDALETLKSEFNDHVSFRTKRPGIVQVLAPLFHEDGDMIDVFIDLPSSPNSEIRITDHGLTLMRLSYVYDIDTPTKRKIFNRILSENGVKEEHGRLFIESSPEYIYPAFMQFAQTVAKVSNMQLFKREVVQNLFYEMLGDFVTSTLYRYHPQKDCVPDPKREELQVDWNFSLKPRPIFLYGVKDSAKSRFAALACREFQIVKLPFRSVIVHEDFENGLSKRDQALITNAVDKQFTTLADFQQNAEAYFEREAEGQIVQ